MKNMMILSLEKTPAQKTFIKVMSTGTIMAMLMSGCDVNISEPSVTSDSPTNSETMSPASSPSPTSAPSPTPEIVATISPAPTEKVVLSAKDDICRLKDPISISKSELEQITAERIKIGNEYKTFLCTTNPDGAGKTYLLDYFTDKLLFEIVVDTEKDTVTYIPQDTLTEMGKAEWDSADTIHLYMKHTLKMSEEDSQKELDKIKTAKDLRIWYETLVPKDQQVVVPWTEYIGLEASNQSGEVAEQNKVLEKYREEHKILV